MSRSLKMWITILFLSMIAINLPEFITAFRHGPDWDFFFVGKLISAFLGLGVISYLWTSRKLKRVSPPSEPIAAPHG